MGLWWNKFVLQFSPCFSLFFSLFILSTMWSFWTVPRAMQFDSFLEGIVGNQTRDAELCRQMFQPTHWDIHQSQHVIFFFWYLSFVLRCLERKGLNLQVSLRGEISLCEGNLISHWEYILYFHYCLLWPSVYQLKNRAFYLNGLNFHFTFVNENLFIIPVHSHVEEVIFFWSGRHRLSVIFFALHE